MGVPKGGEGIRPAIESALIEAQVILDAPDYSALSLRHYGEHIAKRFGHRSNERESAFEMPDWPKQSLASTLMRSHWFTQKVVTEKWFLHQQIPPLQIAV